MLLYTEDFYPLNDTVINFCGYEDTYPMQNFGPTIRECFILHYVVSGAGTLYLKERSYPLQKGDIFLLNPNESTYYVADDSSPWSYYWIGISGVQVLDFLKTSQIYTQSIIKPTDNVKTKHIGKLLKSIVHTSTESPSPIDHAKIYSHLFLLLYEISSLFPTDYKLEDNIKNSYVTQAKQYIQSNYHHPITVSDIADNLNINRSYLYTLFKKTNSNSPKDYLTTIRMARAKQLLSNTTNNISEIADAIGYKSSSSFSKAFKTYTGDSPTLFRTKITSDNNC